MIPLQEQNPHNPYTAQVDKPIGFGCLIAFLFIVIPFGLGIWLLFTIN